MNSQITSFLDANPRHLRVAAFAVVGFSIPVILWALYPYVRMYMESRIPMVSDTQVATSTTSYHMNPSVPVRLKIPKLSIDASFETLGLQKDNTIEVPKGYDTVGWYTLGATPGDIGPAVILGHVDSKAGPAVFYSLGQLNKGDRFSIYREDGTEAVFEVDALERNSQDAFPTEKVYGPIGYAGIRLVTCSGVYDHETRRYSNNLVVYGHLVEPERKNP